MKETMGFCFPLNHHHRVPSPTMSSRSMYVISTIMDLIPFII